MIPHGRLSDGSRTGKTVEGVMSMLGASVTLQEIFRFKEEGFDKNRKILGQFQAMGMIPTFIEKFEQRGLKIPRSLFTTSSSAKNQKQSLLKSGLSIKRPPGKPFPSKRPPGRTNTLTTGTKKVS